MSFEHWLTTPKEWYRLRPIAQARRKYPSPQLDQLWQRLRRRQLHRLEFRRQEVIGAYLADFFSYGARLAIVIETPDLSGHLQKGAMRTKCFDEREVFELRFTSAEVDDDIERVMAEISQVADRRRRRRFRSGPWGTAQEKITEQSDATPRPGPTASTGTLPAGEEGESRDRRIVVRRSVDGQDLRVSESVGGYQRWQSSRRQWRKLKGPARELRKRGTTAELRLWQRLRGQRADGLKFRRQHVIGSMVVDFYCSSLDLVIEVDGAVHWTTTAHDAARDHELLQRGLTILHVANDEVRDNIDSVVERILAIANALRTTSLRRYQPLRQQRR